MGERKKTPSKLAQEVATILNLRDDQMQLMPKAVRSLLEQVIRPPFMVTIAVDLMTGNVRNLMLSTFPAGGTPDELSRVAQALTQAAQFVQQKALEIAKQEIKPDDSQEIS
jgi:hypothetical protein